MKQKPSMESITIPKFCRISSVLFNFSGEANETDLTIRNKIPSIDCCSKFFEASAGLKNIELTIFKSLHEIREIEGSEIETELKLWERFGNYDFKETMFQYKYCIGSVVSGILILVLVVWFRFGKSCARKEENNIRVSFDTREIPNNQEIPFKREIRVVRDNVYPIYI